MPTSSINLDDSGIDKVVNEAGGSQFTNLQTITFVEDDPAIRELFYGIFRQFGTHYVSQITMGGRLSAYTSVQLTDTMDITTASASMKLEYDALFSATADASGDWKKVDGNWSTEREIQFDVIGGESSGLAGFTPAYGSPGAGSLVGVAQDRTL